MRDDDPIWKLSLAWAAAAFTAACLAVYALRAWLAGRALQRNARGQVVRLASEIVAVAETIVVDLVDVPRDSTIADFLARARACRQRAEATLAQNTGLRRVDLDRLNSDLEVLHDEHRRVVNLRSDVDAALAALRSGRPAYFSRSCRFVTRSKPRQSRWSSSGFHTRPSTIM